MRSIWLAYHDVHDALPRDVEPHVAVYHVSRTRFAEHLAEIRASGLRVITPRSSRAGGWTISVVMTFDDGYRGACEIAAPMLKEAGYTATFYVTRDLTAAGTMPGQSPPRGRPPRHGDWRARRHAPELLGALADEVRDELLSRRATWSPCSAGPWRAPRSPAAVAARASRSAPGGGLQDLQHIAARRQPRRRRPLRFAPDHHEGHQLQPGEDVMRLCRFEVGGDIARGGARSASRSTRPGGVPRRASLAVQSPRRGQATLGLARLPSAQKAARIPGASERPCRGRARW